MTVIRSEWHAVKFHYAVIPRGQKDLVEASVELPGRDLARNDNAVQDAHSGREQQPHLPARPAAAIRRQE